MSRSVSALPITDSAWDKDDTLEFTVVSGMLIFSGTVQECRAYIEEHPGRWFGCSAYTEYSEDEWWSYQLPDYMAPIPTRPHPLEYAEQHQPIRRTGYLMGWMQSHHNKPKRAKGAVSIRKLSDLEGD